MGRERILEKSLAVTTQRAVQAEITAKRKLGLRQVSLIAFIFTAIAACEYVFAFQNVAYGIIIALGLVLLVYLLVSVLHLDETLVKLAESLALIPLYILFTSSLPWFFLNQQYLLPAVYACILGLCLWHIYQKNLSLKELFGFRKDKLFKWVLVGIAIGIPTGTAEYFILRPAPAFPAFEVTYLFRDMAYMLLFVALGEELLFRGFIQRDMAEAFGWKWGLFGASLLFAVMHLTWRSIPELGFVFLAGLILGALYLKTRSLVTPIVAHGINNVVLVAVLPYIFMK